METIISGDGPLLDKEAALSDVGHNENAVCAASEHPSEWPCADRLGIKYTRITRGSLTAIYYATRCLSRNTLETPCHESLVSQNWLAMCANRDEIM